jgi:hypothetical protein
MKKIIFTSVILLVAALFGACTQDWIDPNPNGNIPSNTLRLTLAAKGGNIEMSTRSLVTPVPGEEDVTRLYLLFFEPSNDRSGAFIDYVKVDGPLLMHANIDLDLGFNHNLSASNPYNILAIANITDENRYMGNDGVTAWLARWEGQTEAQVMSQSYAWAESGMPINNGELLMSGRVTKARDEYALKMTLTRNVSRFDVVNNLKNEYDLISVEIRNAYPSSTIWEGSVDYTDATARLRFFYALDNLAGADVIGGLYAFENRVVVPAQNDIFTTCLIIGLYDKTADRERYFRVNIAPEDNPQSLKRSSSYRVTIRNVGGDGYKTPELAYAGLSNELDYVINNWDLENDGIIIQDGNSTLAIPSKTVRFGTEGGSLSYSIFVSSISTPAPVLYIRHQTYDPNDGSLNATLDANNVLTVTATPLSPFETERKGTITLSYAGLESTVNVIQSVTENRFLRIHQPDNRTPRFAPFAGLASGEIRIEASGPWAARLIMEAPFGFSFSNSGPAQNISSVSPLVTENRFRIYTMIANSQPTIREAFVMVWLEDDPENSARMFRIIQNAAGGIELYPRQTSVTFNGMGTDLAQIPNNVTNIFRVYPTTDMVYDSDSDTDVEVYNDWEVAGISGPDANKFAIFDEFKDLTYPGGENSVSVKAIGSNLSGRTYNATLRIQLVKDASVYTLIQLAQVSATLSITPNTFTPVGITGGFSSAITVETDPSLTWSATVATTGTGGGRSLVRHEAKLVLYPQGTDVVAGAEYPVTQQFRVEFPKVYYPNREIPISATVTVQVASLTGTVTVNQAPLASRGLNVFNTNNGWGTLQQSGTDRYFGGFQTAIRQVPGYAWQTAFNANTTYLHVGNQSTIPASVWTNYATMTASSRWGIMVLTADQNTQGSRLTSPANSPMNGRYTIVSNGASGSGQPNPGAVSTKIYQLLMNGPAGTVPPGTQFLIAGESTRATVWPATAVSVMRVSTNTSHSNLVIDPLNHLIYIGEGQLFNSGVAIGAGPASGAVRSFLDNLMIYIGNAAKYGTHFTDLMLEPDWALPTGRVAQPSPLDDSYWGANAGVSR